MPRGAALSTEREAVKIVRDEYEAAGWTVGPPLSKTQERREGCDFFVAARDGTSHPIEVKGWGESFLGPDGSFTYPADINAQQRERAYRDSEWRLEIVANLTAARSGIGRPERLTLHAEEVCRLGVALKWAVPLDGLEHRVRSGSPS